MNLSDKWLEGRSLETISSRVKKMLNNGKTNEAVELLRETIVDKCTIFGATGKEEIALQQTEQKARAALTFSTLRKIGVLDNNFLNLVESKTGFLDLAELQKRHVPELDIQ